LIEEAIEINLQSLQLKIVMQLVNYRYRNGNSYTVTTQPPSLSNDAKVLYSLLRDRHQLSTKNKWINDKNEVFLIYSRNEMSNMLRVTEKTALKAVNQLKELNLLSEVKQGLNKPNLIYLSH